ncbi:SDR family oxidoreductase [Pseudovibrio sp. Tun.PSC04-5.I4]|uniref:SDR family NAD(P)-dependent oxidoreductase n=1 Tax=Pseudovibrio sp. Tun.PSC04-5.I4 TaxID=1798213 RepID=UPI00087F8F14|nr:SDR family oxidoreductase [Pseudovibrio sp. Tun.PSC04-5.I4]SDR48085.1 NAD(P)-dependent dehydrogenase, short-chain alcohol dehydrogenase family [Pseudovibrio sp. Tun.PSC04-5.I4]
MISHPLSPSALFDLTDRTALVTGSSRGIGAAIAHGLAQAGAEVIVHGQSQNAADARRSAILAEGGIAHALCADLSARGAGRQLVQKIEDQFGKLDILVINASAQINAELPDVSDEDFDFQLDVNVRSTFEMLQESLPKMAERNWGRVVSIGSINQLRPKEIVTTYAATKAAQHNLVQSQARAYAKYGVLLNSLTPGLIDTDRNKDRKEGDPKGWETYTKSLNWMGRAGTPEEMVGAALFLASDACSFMTGENIVMTGGF